MIGETMVFASYILCLLLVTGVLLYIIRRQQRNIDNLTDRLMARNYVEYKSMNGIKEEDASPAREEDEPKTWYDH